MALALALGATRPASALLQLAALAGAVALLLPNAAEPRVLLTLDDFGAVGDGIANDTQVSTRSTTFTQGNGTLATVSQ